MHTVDTQTFLLIRPSGHDCTQVLFFVPRESLQPFSARVIWITNFILTHANKGDTCFDTQGPYTLCIGSVGSKTPFISRCKYLFIFVCFFSEQSWNHQSRDSFSDNCEVIWVMSWKERKSKYRADELLVLWRPFLTHVSSLWRDSLDEIRRVTR
jgi:hypothetical protein